MAHPNGLTGAVIKIIDFRKSLAERKAMRKYCGPYMWTVGAPLTCQLGRGFYFASKSHTIGDSTFSLRIHHAPCMSRHALHSYPYADRGGAIYAYVVSLPHGRGFLPAYGEGPSMWGAVDTDTIYPDMEEAGLAAHDAARRAAEHEEEAYQCEETEGF